MGLHEILTSISCEIVGQNFVRGVISEAHVLGNDRIEFYSAVCGRRNSLQEGFFDSLSRPNRGGCFMKQDGLPNRAVYFC